MSLTRRHLLHAFAACVVLPLIACQRTAAGLSKDKIMQKYPMKTYAVGRFLIDLPEAAKDISMSLRIFGTTIEWKPSTEAQYQKLLSTRVNGLKGSNPETQLFVRDEIGVVPQSRIILFEEDSTLDGFIGYEAYRYAEEVNGYFILTGSAARKKVANVIPSANEVLKLVQPRHIDPKMTERGICFDNAFISGADPEWGEDIAITARFDNISMMFNSQVIGRVDDGPSLLERAERLNGFPGAQILRKSKRVLAGLNGAEVSFIDTPEGIGGYNFKWEYEGQSNSIAKPAISTSVATKGPISIPQEELLGLWDAMLASIRLRPGAV